MIDKLQSEEVILLNNEVNRTEGHMAQKLPGWHAENVRGELRKRFGTLIAFARANGLSPQIVCDVLRSPNASARVELIIASTLGVPAAEIWPDRWTEDGRKLDRAELKRRLRADKAAA